MRNVQQWHRNPDNRLLRVFKSGGIKKTLETFLQGVYPVTSAAGRTSGQIVHTQTDQYRINKGDYLVFDWTTKSLTLFSTEAQLFEYMLNNNFNFEGVEKVRSMVVSSDADNTALIMRWGNWAHSSEKASDLKRVQVEGGGNAVLPDTQKIQTIAVDGSINTHMISAALAKTKNVAVDSPSETRAVPAELTTGRVVPQHKCEIPPEGWECTRGAGHGGPCAAVQVKPEKPKKKSFAERLLGFLPIFRR